MGWSAQWRWWQINKQPLLLLINDQCWPFTQWWPCHRTQPKVLISVMLTQGVEPDRLRATIPPAPLNLLLCHPRSSFGCRDLQDYFSRSVSGTLPLWALIPLIILPKKQILNKCISARQGLFFSRDTLSLCSFALDARFGGFNKKGEFGSDISTKNFRLCDFIIVICLLILWYLKWSFLIKYLNFKWYLWRLHVGLDLTENWRQMDLRWINSKEFSDQSSIFG